jgi:hypothetical protein
MKYTLHNGVFKGLGVGAGMQYTGNRSGVAYDWNISEGN